MQIDFRASPAPTLGIEVELGLVDRVTRALQPGAPDILAEIGSIFPEGLHPKAKPELLRCTVEVITGICDTVAEARADLEATLAEVTEAADARDLALMCSGTHPFSHWRDQQVTDNPRYAALVETIGWPARRLAIHGIHFHVGVPSGEHAVAIVGALTYHLPVLLALSASSPYWSGLDTAMASSRTKVFEGLPTAGLPPRLGTWSDFEQVMGTLMTAGVISSIREIWWDIRPHPDFGTVEIRVCDGMATMGEVCALAALAQCLVADLIDRIDNGLPLPGVGEWVVRENKWLAARFGLDADLIVDDQGNRRPTRDVAADLVAGLGPVADRLGCRAELDHIGVIIDRGPSYQRQRAIVDAGGTLPDVVDLLVGEWARGDL